MSKPRFASIELSPAAWEAYGGALGLEGPEAAAVSLGRALAADPTLAAAGCELLLVDGDRLPRLVLAGRFDEAALAGLEAQQRRLEDVVHRLRWVGLDTTIELVDQLARHLEERFDGQLGRFRFTAIPRGGLLVLGLLAYRLGLSRDRVEGPGDGPTVVVDDCCLTGERLAAFLATTERRPVVFAHLLSHPSLRREIELREDGGVVCLAGDDLVEPTPTEPAEREVWLSMLSAGGGSPRYWAGRVEHVCFPWCEPTALIWNPVAGRVEQGWRLVPPERLLTSPVHLPRLPVEIGSSAGVALRCSG